MDLNHFDLIEVCREQVGVAEKKRCAKEESYMKSTKRTEPLNKMNGI